MRKQLVVWLMLISVLPTLGQELTGTDIIQRASDIMNQDQVQAIMELTITTTTGQQRTFVYESFSKNRGEKNLLRYLEPSRVKGQAVLMLNHADDIWMYFPKTNRADKKATHVKKRKFEGSDFAYEDMGSGDSFVTDFTHRRLDDVKIGGKDCYQVELMVKPDVTSSYSKIVVAMGKEDFVMQAIDYYDDKDTNYQTKRLTITKVETIQGIPTATEMVMHSLDDNTETTMKITSVDYQVELPDEMFTERGLRK